MFLNLQVLDISQEAFTLLFTVFASCKVPENLHTQYYEEAPLAPLELSLIYKRKHCKVIYQDRSGKIEGALSNLCLV